VGVAACAWVRARSHVGVTRSANKGIAGSAVATRTRRASASTGAIMIAAQMARATFQRASLSLACAPFLCGVLCAFMFGAFRYVKWTLPLKPARGPNEAQGSEVTLGLTRGEPLRGRGRAAQRPCSNGHAETSGAK
jgi:hypothetical protein